MATFHTLHPQTSPPAAFLRVGHTNHQKLEALHAANRLPYQRFVFDATQVGRQSDFLSSLRRSGAEAVLDLNFAETATAGCFARAVGKLPWGNPERPWTLEDFGPGRNADLLRQMAEFAVGVRANAVLAPTHAIEDVQDGWRAFDLDACDQLRHELDQAGGSHIAIDYQLITTARLLTDPGQLAALVKGVADRPVQNVWIRASGFGATATGARTRDMIEVARQLHELGRPLVIDMAGGFAGLALLAFGAVGGISHGVAVREAFDVADWRKPPTGGGGAGARVYVAALDRYMKEDQARAFFAMRGAKSRLACTDTTCCARGVEDMIKNDEAHFITQRGRQIEDLTRTPEGRRAERFLLGHLAPAVRDAQRAAKLKFAEEPLRKMVDEATKRLERLRDALGALYGEEGEASQSRSPAFRGGAGGAGGLSVVQGGRP